VDLYAAEHQLNAYLDRAAAKVGEARAGQQRANDLEAFWRASERAHERKLRTERLHERLGYHRAMIESHTRNFEELLRRHRTGLRLVEQELGITTNEGDNAA
jgi:hypothetical protein